jgi:hypothetical protein
MPAEAIIVQRPANDGWCGLRGPPPPDASIHSFARRRSRPIGSGPVALRVPGGATDWAPGDKSRTHP